MRTEGSHDRSHRGLNQQLCAGTRSNSIVQILPEVVEKVTCSNSEHGPAAVKIVKVIVGVGDMPALGRISLVIAEK